MEEIDLKYFKKKGFLVISKIFSLDDVSFASNLVSNLILRHRMGDSDVLAASISVGASAKMHPNRNDGVNINKMVDEPFIIGDLIRLEPKFASLIYVPTIWKAAAQLLGTSEERVVFHFSNITRKPSLYGPAIGLHRDADNRYYACSNRQTVRLLFPLQIMNSSNGGTEVLIESHLKEYNKAHNFLINCPTVSPGNCLALHSEILHGGGLNRSEYERDVIVLQFGLRDAKLSYRAAEMMSDSGRLDFFEILKNNHL
ncbi:phytanoyl-CoA dioxygenase family protein [Sphingomonas sp. NCPPB 2930]